MPRRTWLLVFRDPTRSGARVRLARRAEEALVGRFAPAASHAVAVGVSFTLITGLHIVVGELAPKGLALQKTDGTALWVARPIRWFYLVFRWPVTALNAVGNATLRLVGLQPATEREPVHSPEELRYLLVGTQQAGDLEPAEARIASRALAFADRTAASLMTPRTEVDAIPASGRHAAGAARRPRRSPTPTSTASTSTGSAPTSRTRSTRTSGAAPSRPACSRTPGWPRPDPHPGR